MGDPLLYPKLRWPIDLRFEKVENKEILVLNCPMGISPQPLLLVPAVAPIIGCFEGHQSIDEITAKFKSYGIQKKLVEDLVGLLDQHLFLASPRFDSAERIIRSEFKLASLRPAALAGSGYSNMPETLRLEMDSLLAHANGSPAASTKNMIGLVSPHIDYRRGGIAYGLTYHQLRDQSPDLYVLIGTGHQYSRHLFHLTSKDFTCPLGLLPCDKALVDSIANTYGRERAFADEFLHRREHSLELQIPFLTHLKSEPRILPILVGSFHHMLKTGKYPENFEEYDSFASAMALGLKNRINEGQKICFIAGVDMAHVGQSFGDTDKLTPEFMQQIYAQDQIYLDTLKAQNKHQLFDHIAQDSDRRRICGFPTMYTVLDVLDRLNLKYEAHVFDYRQAIDYPRECAVTFAGMGLYQGQGPRPSAVALA